MFCCWRLILCLNVIKRAGDSVSSAWNTRFKFMSWYTSLPATFVDRIGSGGVYLLHGNVRQETVHVDVAVFSEFLGEFHRQFPMHRRREVAQGIAYRQLKPIEYNHHKSSNLDKHRRSTPPLPPAPPTFRKKIKKKANRKKLVPKMVYQSDTSALEISFLLQLCLRLETIEGVHVWLFF